MALCDQRVALLAEGLPERRDGRLRRGRQTPSAAACFRTSDWTRIFTPIRSYEKLTGEGVTFMGSELLTLLEKILPGKFGGSVSDYQLVEEEAGGATRVSLLSARASDPWMNRWLLRRLCSSLPPGTPEAV